jgi:hypothetical protein
MSIDRTEGGSIVVTGEDDIRQVQRLAQKYAMKLELTTGLTHSGGSVVARIRAHYGFHGSRASVYRQFCERFGLEE